MKRERPGVVVIGAGFGGMAAVRALRRVPVEVTVIDRNNYHTFQPLLYQVATAGLEPGDIAYAVRGIFRKQKNVAFLMGNVVEVELDRRVLWMSDGRRIPFDFLVVATGAETNDFGVEGVSRFAFGLKSMDDAVSIRNHVLLQFELCNTSPRLVDEGALTFVIVGGGPTGVEVAGAMMELFDHVLRKDFPDLTDDPARVILVEMGKRLLPSFTERQGLYALEKLRKWGVEVDLETRVMEIDASGCVLSPGGKLDSKTVIWAAGVKGTSPRGFSSIPAVPGRRLEVSPNLSLSEHEHVFVVGDLAGAEIDGVFLPQVAPTAIQQGQHAAREIRAAVLDQESRRFKYRDFGQMATIGRHAAAVELPGGLKLRGYPAWVAWLLLHLIKLIGFRNRASVLVNWVWNYFTYDRTARLIFGTTRRTAGATEQFESAVKESRERAKDGE